MDAILEKINNHIQKNQKLNLDDLKNKIRNRILSEFIAMVNKPKLTLWQKYSIPAIFISPLLGGLLFYSFFSSSHPHLGSLLDLSWFISGLFPVAFPIIGIVTNFGRSEGYYNNSEEYISPYKTKGIGLKEYFKGYFNFERESKKYFGSFELPLNTENEIKQYIIDKSDQFYCRKFFNQQETNNIFQLTSEEIKNLQEANLNNFQKQFLINTINQNKGFSLSNVQELMRFSNVEILKDTAIEVKEKLRKII